MEDHRQYRRIRAGVRVLYQGLPTNPTEQQYLSAVAKDLSLGGMFLSTENPFPRGTRLILELRTPEMDPWELPVCAHALVRWRRRWGRPRGMGIEFVELRGVARRRIQDWVETVLGPEAVATPGSRFPLPLTFLRPGAPSDPKSEQFIQTSDRDGGGSKENSF